MGRFLRALFVPAAVAYSAGAMVFAIALGRDAPWMALAFGASALATTFFAGAAWDARDTVRRLGGRL